MTAQAYQSTERERYARRREAGLCVVCAWPSPDNARCERCRSDNAERRRMSYARRIASAREEVLASESARVHLPVVTATDYAPPQRVRGRTETLSRSSRKAIAREGALYPEQPGVDYLRPRTLEECDSVGLGTRSPCPFVSCKHHLYLDVNERNGSIKVNFPDRDIDELADTCSLRVADRGGATLDGVANAMNLTRERTRQLELQALAHVRASLTSREWTALDDALDHLEETSR